MPETLLVDKSARPKIILNDDGTLSFIGGTSVPVGGSPGLFADGVAGAPSIAFTSEPSLGLWRSSAGNMTLQGVLNVTGNILGGADLFIGVANAFVITGRTQVRAPAVGVFTLAKSDLTIGSNLKVDALPTVASGFGGSPAIVAGSTPLAGAVDVGTGGAATSGVINFNGTAFPSAPFVVATNKTTNAVVRATATATQLTLSSTTAWGANDIVSWIAISPK